MKVSFITPTKLSILDITTMGDSSKRGDESTIGCFDSGFKYAIALLLRANVGIEIKVTGTELMGEQEWEQAVSDTFTFSTVVDTCDATGKSKELIVVEGCKEYHGGHASPHYDASPTSEPEYYKINTAFALQLGHNWELWMALRELYSNMLDEGGYYEENDFEVSSGTVITLDFDEDNEFYEVWVNKNVYINETLPSYAISHSVSVLDNPDGYLKIYKKNILVYKDEEVPSKFAYNISFGEIDERRVLLDVYGVSGIIANYIMSTSNENFLREIIKGEQIFSDKEFLYSRSPYNNASNLINSIAEEVYENFGEVYSYPWILESIREREDCRIGSKKIKSIQDSLFNYSTTVVVETEPVSYSEPTVVETEDDVFEDSFVSAIKSKYKFNLNVEVKISKLLGSKVIADKFEKCLIIDEEFNIDEDFPEFMVQYIDLTRPGNVVKELSKYLVELLKK